MNAEARNERIFYQDPSRTEFDAKVLEIAHVESDTDSNETAAVDDVLSPIEARVHIRFDATIFYPEGGGQPPDLGWIGTSQVVDVQEIDGDVWHTVTGEGAKSLRVGDTVHLRIDGKRRHYHTQQHTGQHLLSAVLEQDYDIHTLSFHLGEEYCTIDVSAKNPAELSLGEIEAKVEAWIASDVPVRVHYCPPEDVSSFRLRKRPPVDEAVIRVVEIDEYDWSPCGGTHVERTGQIRVLKILSAERYKGTTRLYFVAGAHAIEVLARVYEEARRAALLLSAGVENLAARVAESIEKAALLDRKCKRYAQQSADNAVALAAERLAMEKPSAKSLAANAGSEVPGAATAASARDVLVFELEDEDADRATALARAAAAIGRAALALSAPEMTVVAQTPASGDFPALATALKPTMARFGGRGGGSLTFFRANFQTLDEARRFVECVKDLLRDGTAAGASKRG